MDSATEPLMVCHDARFYGNGTTRTDVFHEGDPFTSPSDLIFLQVSLIALVSQCINFYLKPLGQSTLVSQTLGGLIIGPSALMKLKVVSKYLFPPISNLVLETLAGFGVMYFFFLMGLKTDPAIILMTERKAVYMGVSVFISALGLPTGLTFIMRKYVSMDHTLANALPYIGALQAFTGSAVIGCLLAELKIINTDIGRLTLSLAMFGDLIGISLTVVIFSTLSNGSESMWLILCVAALASFIMCVLRPVLLWMLARSLDGKPVSEFFIVSIFAVVLVIGFMSEIVGQHYVLGPLLFGFSIPEGPPLGSTIIAKLETLSAGFFYPIYLAVCGLHTDVFKIDLRSMWIVGLVLSFSVAVKICAVMIYGYYNDIPKKESLVIGLILNTKGITELAVYNFWKGNKILSEKEFSLMVISVIVVTAIITPLVRYLYDPTEQYIALRRSCIQHNKRDSELRVMVCIHDNEHVPALINLIEASYASQESAVVVIALVLVELLGRSRPLLVAHQPHNLLRTASFNSSQIWNALKQYQQQHAGYASVESFTSVSSFIAMFHDVCRMAVDRRATILIMPFHKQWEIDGGVEILNRGIQSLNIRVLENAPCSVGILIDRGILSGRLSILTGRSLFNVVVFFIGGADDAEALAYGARMAGSQNVVVTVARFLLFGEENSKERRRESDLVNEYRKAHAGNPRFDVIDEVVRDGVDMSTRIRRIIDYFDLAMVGREHADSALIRGHDQWCECPELGTIGDMLASQDFITKASVLVIQQQRIGGKMLKHKMSAGPNERDQHVHDIPYDEGSKGSWTISMDKY
ncbi:hypothetical protein L6164_030144 [Bauhinia variegata]|uniref:Uncharacterized protein n=1 Tax=Bauhinia variegata TaxID=167791 RepID=A0ACB9LAZ5_BAUVA|nr:hypothetical protein L6164_030144 [Bauhinia variegata]